MRTFHIAIAFLAIAADTSGADPSIRCIEPSATTGTSRAVVVGNVPLVHTSQVMPTKPAADAAEQTLQVLATMHEQLRSVGSSLYHCGKLNIYAVDEAAATGALTAIQREFAHPLLGASIKPAVSVVLTRLPRPGALVAIDTVAYTEQTPRRRHRCVPGLRKNASPAASK